VPIAPYARILVSLNNGPPQRGGVRAAFGDVVQLSAESTIGWGVPAAIWEITAYPAGWAAPAGWAVDPITKACVLVGNLSSLPPFALPAAGSGLWGKWRFRLRVNGGGGDLTDWSTAIEIVSPRGVHDLASGEGGEFGAERGWPGDQQKNLRLLDQAVAGAGSTVSSIGVQAPLHNTGTATAPVLGVDLVSATADGAMAHQDKAKLDAATADPTPGALVQRDSAGNGSFHVVIAGSGIIIPAGGASGFMQLQATTGAGATTWIRAQQGAPGKSGGVLVLGGGDGGTPGAAGCWAGNTQVQLGDPDATAKVSASFQLLAGGTGVFLGVLCNAAGASFSAAKGITFTVGATAVAMTAAGLAVNTPALTVVVPWVQMANATAPPTTNPAGGVALYAEAGAWKARSPAGVVATMAPAGAALGSQKVLDWIAGATQTSNATATAVLAYALPPGSLLEIDASVQARNPATGASSWLRRIVRAKRAAGAASGVVLKSTQTPVPDDDESGGLVVGGYVNGTSLELRVKGLSGTTLVWFASARVQLFAP
jgi:hypothetical protein